VLFLTFTVHEGEKTVSVYYLDLLMPVQVIRDILKTNAKQDIAVLFICDKNIVPGRTHGETVWSYNESLEALQILTDGRIHVFDGESVKEWHYEPFDKGDFRNAGNRTLHIGSTIDVAGMEIIELDHRGRALPEHNIAIRFTHAKFWEKPEEPKHNGFNQGGYTGAWDEFFKQNFNHAWQQQYTNDFNRRTRQQQEYKVPPSPNGSGKRSDYEVLGLAHTATDAEIKSAYRRLMKENHPDKHPDNVEAATKRTQEINAAYASIRRVKGFK
jgi:DnaJ-domain-containing protein 1